VSLTNNFIFLFLVLFKDSREALRRDSPILELLPLNGKRRPIFTSLIIFFSLLIVDLLVLSEF